jgi:uncharacterized protein (TIGR03435 family)
MHFRLTVFCLGLAASSLLAAPPAFEVASIKVSEPAPMGRMMIRMGVDAEMLRYNGVPLREIIRIAYRVKDFQIEGPDWLESARYDIVAKLPEGATEEQVPEMLQALLAERFQLQLHKERKEHGVLVLVPGKDGAKLKPAEVQAAAPGAAGPGGPPAPGRGGPAMGRGMMRMMMSPQGMVVTAPSTTLSNLAEILSRFTERPILDETGIQGEYAFEFTFQPESTRMMPGGLRGPVPPGGPGAGPGPVGGTGPGGGAAEPAASIYDAVQRYGLKLEARKAPMEILVIDSIAKTPTEN